MSALRETQDLLADTTAELAATKARLAETLAELDKRAWSRGSDRFSNIEYCGLCHYSREWVAQHGHGEKCLLRNADSASVPHGNNAIVSVQDAVKSEPPCPDCVDGAYAGTDRVCHTCNGLGTLRRKATSADVVQGGG